MKRALPVLVLSLVAAGIGTGTAHAYPVFPPPPCAYTLTGPTRAGDVVTVSVQSAACGPLGQPYYAVACLQPGNGPIQCAQGRGTDPALVSLPYQPGVPFTVSGRGCSNFVNMVQDPNCQYFDPVSAPV